MRIYPLAIVAVTVVWLTGIPASDVTKHNVSRLDTDTVGYATNVFLVQDVIQSHGGDGSIIGLLWSLPLELQMYAALPVLYFCRERIGHGRALFAGWLLFVLAAFVSQQAFKMVGTEIVSLDAVSIHFSRILYYAPCFLGGFIAFQRWRIPGPRLPFATLPVILGCAIVTYAGSSYLPAALENLATPAVGMGWCLVLGLTLPLIAEPSLEFVRASAATIARYSYSVYLLHIVAIWIAFDLADGLPVIVQVVLFVALLLALVIAGYHVIEAPGIAIGRQVSKPSRTIPVPSQ